MREPTMTREEAVQYFELSERFREIVMDHDPDCTGRESLMRYPGDGNRHERRALKARARKALKRA